MMFLLRPVLGTDETFLGTGDWAVLWKFAGSWVMDENLDVSSWK